MIQKWLKKIPAAYRRAFYSLPLFIQWIFGLTLEKGDREIRAAQRSMMLSLAFISITGLCFFSLFFLNYFLPEYDWNIQYAIFVVHTINAGSYILIALIMVYLEIRGKSSVFGFIDRLSASFERIISR